MFAVTNVVLGDRETVTGIIAEVQPMLEAVAALPGFISARLYQTEDGGEGMLMMEWESRDAFMAYRQSDIGHKTVENALRWHPHISFYEIVKIVGPS